jgi:flagellar basal-body rod protein FlgG
VVTAEGMPLEPSIIIPPDAMSVTIASDGTVSVTTKANAQPTQLGQIQLANFINPAGLNATGHNLLVPTGSSGDPQLGNPGTDGRGTLLQGSIEHANVEVVDEMIGLIAAQRAYEVDTKVISAADSMMQQATQLR